MPRALEQSVETLLEADRDDNRRHVDLAVSLRLCDVDEDADGRARWMIPASHSHPRWACVGTGMGTIKDGDRRAIKKLAHAHNSMAGNLFQISNQVNLEA